MKYNFEIRNGQLYQGNELYITSNGIIQDFLIFNNRVVLLFDPESIGSDRNVFCYDFDKNLIWQVEEPYKIHERNYYNSIYVRDNKLCIYSDNGFELTVDAQTGVTLDHKFIR